MTLKAFQGSIFHVLGDPAGGNKDAYEYIHDGLLLVEEGIIKALGPRETLGSTLPDSTPVRQFPDGLIVPGFIDTHIHFPQTDIIGAHGKQLLDWLQTYTFPAELAFADPHHAAQAAQFFVDELLRNGTTTALVFATVHETSAQALFAAAHARGMRLITGKVLMDRNAPPGLLDGPDLGYDESRTLIRRWHGKGRLSYAVTPRFAVSCTPAQLRVAGQLIDEFGDVYLQTHLAENKTEIEFVASLFPEARDYLDVYARAGLVTNRSLFAHSIHLDPSAMMRIAAAGAAISFCPTSNLFLGSGLFNLRAAKAHGIKVGLGTDVGGGTSFSLFAAMNEAYKVGQLRGETLDPLQSFYLATLGGAEALGLHDRVGNLRPGKEADFLVLDRKATPLLARRLALCRSIEEELFALGILGDDRAIAFTFLMGEEAHRRGD